MFINAFIKSLSQRLAIKFKGKSFRELKISLRVLRETGIKVETVGRFDTQGS